MIYLAYILPIVFNLAFLIYQKYQNDDLSKIYKIINLATTDKKDLPAKKWHPWGAVLRVLIMTPFFLLWKDALLSGVICYWIWELGQNKFILKQRWFYDGSSAGNDKKLKSIEWWIMAGLLIGSIAIKIFL